MKGYLVDENLPARLTFTPALPVVPATNLGLSPTDTMVGKMLSRIRSCGNRVTALALIRVFAEGT